MIRAIIFIAILMSAIATKAQLPLFSGAQNSMQPVFGNPGQAADTNYLRKKWFVTRYAGISTGFVAFKGGSSNYLSAPLAWQVNKQFTNNIYAFGGVSATPYLLQYNGAVYQPGNDKNSFMRANNFGINPAARIGVMYINSDRTFSITGSISVSSSSYNGYSPIYAPANSHVKY
ncbi:hypothetical protein SAMN05216311_107213 [Chitinophaga sp. CF418]|nr:hypothetical protein SAMN05216311_107213 [Chitinophaga sp. CF418]